MASEARSKLFNISKNFISVKYFPNFMPSSFFNILSKYTNTSSKGQILTDNVISQYTKCIGEDAKKRLFSFLRSKHCHSIAAQRVRRTIQISNLYHSLGYDLATLRAISQNMLCRFFSRLRVEPFFLLGAVAFSWNEENISDDELKRASEEINFLQRSKAEDVNWEKVVVKNGIQVLRQPICDSDHFQYKVLGTYKDVSARSFYHIQIDLEYRKKWDKNVISLERIDYDKESGSEIVHWVTHFPYPLTSREYIYIRRYQQQTDKNMMVIVNRGLYNHPSVKNDGPHVRVTEYCSKMVIKPHTNFDENGFDFVLTYFDDPKSNLPKMAQSWAASSGIPDFVDKLHKAAMRLQQENLLKKTSSTPTITINTSPNTPTHSQQNNVFNDTSNGFSTGNANEESSNKDTRLASSISDTDIIQLTSNKENLNPGVLNTGECDYNSDNRNENNTNNTLNVNNNFNTNKVNNKIRHNYTDTSSLPL